VLSALNGLWAKPEFLPLLLFGGMHRAARCKSGVWRPLHDVLCEYERVYVLWRLSVSWPQPGDKITLFCRVPSLSRLGTARGHIEPGTSGVVEYVYSSGDVFEIRFGARLVTVARIEFTPH
jgi:hypothetical protein